MYFLCACIFINMLMLTRGAPPVEHGVWCVYKVKTALWGVV